VPAGKIVAKVLDGKQVIGTSTQTVTALKSVTTTVKPTAAGLRALRSIQGNSVRLKLEAAFTPAAVGTGDAEITPTAPIAVTRSNIKLVLSTIKKGRR
jgi:hypothetical protein